MSLLNTIRAGLGIRPDPPPLISVVLNLRTKATLTDQKINSAVVRAWGREPRKDLNEHIVYKPPICFVKFEGIVLMVTNAGRKYCPEQYLEQAIAEFPEERQKKVVREHKAFLTIDLMSPKDPRRKQKHGCYRRMAHLAAEFVDENCLGIYIPETGQMRPYDSEVIKALRSDRPLEELERWGSPPVAAIADNDPRLIAAVAEARRRWPEFVWAFEHRCAEQSFSVKAHFIDGDSQEWMWVSVSSIVDGAINGSLGNAPVNVQNVREGDKVTLRASEIGDWVYNDGETLIGGYSIAPDER